MTSSKIFFVLLFVFIIGSAVARPGYLGGYGLGYHGLGYHGGYYRSYPFYGGYGHGFGYGYGYPYYGHGYGGFGYGHYY